jgi:site-specific recombinase XerD
MLPHLGQYLKDLNNGTYSSETAYNYQRDLNVFQNYLEEYQKQFNKITLIDITEFVNYLQSSNRKTSKSVVGQKTLSTQSINRTISSIKSYFSYLQDNNHICPVLPSQIHTTKAERKNIQQAEFNDIVGLIESPTEFEKKDRLVALRNRAMLEVLFATGMRISELINLNKNQIDATGKIFILGKGRKQRFVYLTDRAKYHIEQYLRSRKDNHPALFVPYRGTNVKTNTSRISPNYLQMKIKQYRERLRINVPTSAHSLRHGFATYLAEQGANPAAIQILLGHESLDTTTRYVNTSDKYAEKTHHKYHPLKDA